MPQSSDYLSALSQYHPGVNLSGQQGLIDASNNASGQNMSTSDFVSKYNNDPGVLNAYNQKYQTLAAPQQGALDTQIGSLNNQKDIFSNAADLSSTQTNQQYDQSNRQTSEAAGNAQMAAYNSAQNNGFGNTVLSTGAQQQVQSDLANNLSYNQSNRANALAGIALNNASQNTQLSGSIGQLQAQKGALNYQTSTNAQDAYNQNTNEQFARQDALFNDSLKLPQGRTISTGPSLTVQGSGYDPNGFISSISKIMPVLQQTAGGSDIAKALFPGIASQYGLNFSPDALSKLTNFSQSPASVISSGGGGGNSYKPAAPVRPAAPTFGASQQQEASSEIGQLAGQSDYASNPNKYVELLQQHYPGISYEQAYSIYREAVRTPVPAASSPVQSYALGNQGAGDLGGGYGSYA